MYFSQPPFNHDKKRTVLAHDTRPRAFCYVITKVPKYTVPTNEILLTRHFQYSEIASKFAELNRRLETETNPLRISQPCLCLIALTMFVICILIPVSFGWAEGKSVCTIDQCTDYCCCNIDYKTGVHYNYSNISSCSKNFTNLQYISSDGNGWGDRCAHLSTNQSSTTSICEIHVEGNVYQLSPYRIYFFLATGLFCVVIILILGYTYKKITYGKTIYKTVFQSWIDQGFRLYVCRNTKNSCDFLLHDYGVSLVIYAPATVVRNANRNSWAGVEMNSTTGNEKPVVALVQNDINVSFTPDNAPDKEDAPDKE